MKKIVLVMLMGCLFVVATESADPGGTVVGTVTTNGMPIRAAFVRLQNDERRMNVHVLSDARGRYRAEGVLPGTYRVSVSSFGYDSPPRTGVKIVEGQSVTVDLTATKRPLRWDELSTHQTKALLPAGPGKEDLTNACYSCHKLQAMVVGRGFNEAGFRNVVARMRDVDRGMGWILRGMTDERAADVVSYLTKHFGPGAVLPNPESLPQYAKVKDPEVAEEALGVTYVDYDVRGINKFPFSAVPDGKGSAWIPYYGTSNRIARLNLQTHTIDEFKVPSETSALIHSAMAAPDGTVWFVEQNNGRIGMFDPRTLTMVEYQQPPFQAPGRPAPIRGTKHTLRPTPDNRYVWASGGPLSRFDRETKTFTHITEVPNAYGLDLDRQGNAWFTEFTPEGKIGKVDPQTLKVTKYTPPTKGAPRRIYVAPDGMIWFAEYNAGKLARFDPKTEQFTEYQLPGPDASPYGILVDNNGFAWYMSEAQQVLGRLDPNTGKVIEFPTPYSEGFGRELFMDAEGRIWYGLFSRNRVGYFTVSGPQRTPSR